MSEDRKASLTLLIIASSIFLALYLAWLVWAKPGQSELFWIGSLTQVFSSLAVASLAWTLRGKLENQARQAAWTWIASGMSLWAAGDGVRMLFNASLPARGLLTPSDLVYLGGAALLGTGLLRYPGRNRQQLGALRLLIEAMIPTIAVICLAWMVIFRPVIELVSTNASQYSAILYPTSDLILLVILLNKFIVNETGSVPPAMGWMVAGIGVYSVSDLIFAALSPQGAFSFSNLINFGWVLGDFLWIAAIYSVMREAWASSAPTPALSTPVSLFRRTLTRVQTLLPLVMTVTLGWYTILDGQVQGHFDTLGVWSTVLLGLALIGRQGILTGEYEFKQYARLVDSIAEPTFICNIQGEIQLANPALVTASGYNHSDELFNLSLDQLVSAAQPVEEMLAQGLEDGWTGEVDIVRPDGVLLPVILSLRPLAWSGRKKKSLAATAHDLSEIKRQQTALRQAYEQITAAHDELEKMNALLEQRVGEKTSNLTEAYLQLERQNLALQNLDRLKSDFVSLVSHELRAPLTNINGGIELVLTRARTLPQSAHETLHIVQAEILRLTSFVETILDLSMLDAGRTPVYPGPLDLNEVVQAIQRQMTHLPGAERIHWDLPESPPELLADERAVISILTHLLDNALKYAPEGEIRVSAGTSDGQGWISVTDQGQGIPEQDMGMLFTRFFRSRASDAQTVYGHGLGLYIVQHLLAALNGKIEVSNRPEGGACFTCWLPLMEEEEAGEDNELHDLVG